METIYESEFKFVKFNDTTKVLLIVAKREDKKMTMEELKTETTKSAELIVTKRPLYIINDQKNGENVYTPEIQEWIANTYLKAMIQAGVKKFATIAPKDIFVETSIQQIVEEAGKTSFEVKSFLSTDEAEKWFGV